MAKEMKQDGYRIRMSLRWSEPEIWREVCIPADLSLGDLHYLIQAVMGWESCHLHQFVHKKRVIGVPSHDGWQEVLDEDEILANEIFLRKGSKIEYEYDFGDGWLHDIVSQGTMKKGDRILEVIDGEMACPPEDCGGMPGYEQLLAVLADPKNDEHESMKEWAGEDFDPETFDREALNSYIKALMGGD
ncbi:MAG: plasmid pRiA4b ORF-3 family protein [Lentisphaeria bacterium]|nr:plasmid pRiA4b ORF-3 family protein [Lentisphaeria bacterium]